MTDDPVIQIPPHVIAAIKECAIFSATERAKGNMCCLHVALDDGDVKNENIDFCVEEAEREEHPECLRMARVLQDLSETERDVVYYLFDLWEEQQPGYYEGSGERKTWRDGRPVLTPGAADKSTNLVAAVQRYLFEIADQPRSPAAEALLMALYEAQRNL